MKILANKIAVITGATSGIGEGVAKIFAENGARLALIGRHQEIGCKIEKELSEKYKEKHQTRFRRNDSEPVDIRVGY